MPCTHALHVLPPPNRMQPMVHPHLPVPRLAVPAAIGHPAAARATVEVLRGAAAPRAALGRRPRDGLAGVAAGRGVGPWRVDVHQGLAGRLVVGHPAHLLRAQGRAAQRRGCCQGRGCGHRRRGCCQGRAALQGRHGQVQSEVPRQATSAVKQLEHFLLCPKGPPARLCSYHEQ
jgi:hypothetical protein